RSGRVATPSRRVGGASPCAATQALPWQGTSGSSQDTRPDLQPCGLSPLGVERAVPLWGKPADGQAADKSLQTPLGSEMAQRLAGHGVAPGASLDLAAAALVTAAPRAALGDTVCPAPAGGGGGVVAEGVARPRGGAGGGWAQPPPPPPRPGTFDTVAADGATLSGQPSRAVVGPSHSHDPRRHKRLAREGPAAST